VNGFAKLLVIVGNHHSTSATTSFATAKFGTSETDSIRAQEANESLIRFGVHHFNPLSIEVKHQWKVFELLHNTRHVFLVVIKTSQKLLLLPDPLDVYAEPSREKVNQVNRNLSFFPLFLFFCDKETTKKVTYYFLLLTSINTYTSAIFILNRMVSLLLLLVCSSSRREKKKTKSKIFHTILV